MIGYYTVNTLDPKIAARQLRRAIIIAPYALLKLIFASIMAIFIISTPILASAQSLPTTASEADTVAPNILMQTRHYSELNAQNLSDHQYSPAQPQSDAIKFAFGLKGYIFGLRVIRANYNGWYDSLNYAAYSDIRTSGFGALLKKLEIWAVTSGYMDSAFTPRPDFHVQQNLNKKNRRVEMRYDPPAKKVDITIVPRLGSQGIPPASPQERFEAYDTISAILAIMLKNKNKSAPICKGLIPVFDSKQYYNLRIIPAGRKRIKFNGEKIDALHCQTFYEPVSGFDPEDLPDHEEKTTPLNVYLYYHSGLDLYIPVRFTYKISALTAVIKVTDMDIILP